MLNALITALQKVEERDLIIIFYERLEPVFQVLEKTYEAANLTEVEKRRKHLAGRAI